MNGRTRTTTRTRARQNQLGLNLTMSLGAAAEIVEVLGEVSLVDTKNSALSTVVDERKIEQLPLNGRNFVDLALGEPGVQAFKTRQTGGLAGRGQQMNINGAPGRSNSYLLDGANMKSYHGVAVSSAADTTLGVETVREFRVVTNAFSADYGRAMGGVINVVTKAGTNELHGSGFEFFRDSKMDTRNFFDPGEPPPFTRHQFGFTTGGPIVRDRMFFFGGGEWLRESLGLTQVTTVPNVAARSGGLGPIDPATRRYLDLMPLPNGPGLGGGLARFTFPFDRRTDETFLQGRVDHSFGQNDTLFLRHTLDRATRRLPTGFPQFPNSQESNNQFLTAEEKHIFGPTLLSTARVSYSRLRLGLRLLTEVGGDYAFLPGQPTMGVINIGGIQAGFGPDSTNPQDANTDYLTFSDDVGYTKGLHFLKAGVLVERARTGNTSGQDRPNLKAGVNPSQIILGGPNRYFDPNAFELQPAGFLGNAGRNIMTGPTLINFDLSVVKNQTLATRGRLQLRFEVFNVLNRANFSIPNRVVFSGTREGEAPLSTAGQITSTITDARQLQLGVKLIF